ncbi:carbohydrate-binding protein [Rhizobium straminoryzae]|uniref:SGNH/GDSL hydrolase family protein n=1 Tax=Rhizobium straminoryzae TaxID=1387186 RepID=A0A549T840_9HYPH|nr:carbohydrate-binding protein [Rhizobium straminoryzae]TRL38042.1 hypothetical protein FNA46_13620 [Rhizobium straminoryzae]
MADGPRTTNLNRVAMSDEVIVNRANSTGLQAIQDLAMQLAGSGAIASALNAIALVSAADYARVSYAALNAVTGASNGQTGIALVGADRGIYERQSGAWVRVADLPSDTGQAAAEAAAAAADADRIVAQAAASEALAHRTAIEATEDRIEAATAIITNYRGAWTTGTAYAVRDTVMQGGVQYICTVAHTAGTFATDLAAPRWQIYQGAALADLASQSSTALGAGMIGYERQRTTVASRLEGVSLLEGKHNLRDFYNALYTYNPGISPGASPSGFIGIGYYGDSVSPHVWASFVQQIFQAIPQGAVIGGTSFSIPGPSPATFTGSYFNSGSAVVDWYANDGAGGKADFTYLPSGGHLTLFDAATMTIDMGQQNGFATMRAYFAKGPGMGTATVQLINRDTNAVIDTQTINLADSALGGAKVQWNVSASVKYKMVITASGQVVVLSGFCGGFRSHGIVPLGFGRGGSILSNNNYSSNAIFAYLMAEFNCKLMFIQAKEENAAVNIPATFSRFASLPACSLLVIGSLPDVTSEASQLAIQKIWRDNAMANYAAYFDGYRACRNYTELVRLGWITDGTHPLEPANRFVAQLLHGELGILETFGTKVYRNVAAGEVKASAFRIPKSGYSLGDAAPTIDFVQPYGGGDPDRAILKFIRELWFGDPTAANVMRLSQYGNFGLDISDKDGTGMGLRLGNIIELRNQAVTTAAPGPGGAGVLPTTPAGYMQFAINGQQRRIPYY